MEKRTLKFLALILVISFFGSVQAQNDYAYIGNKKCKKCHIKQFKAWQKTKMANVFELLKPGQRADAKKKAGLDPEKDYTTDKECLGCHTTGYGKKGGFVDEKTTPNLLGVGCEMCHGAGSEYTKKEYMSLKNKKFKRADVVKVGLVSPVGEKNCTEVCHNKKSPFYKPFNFEERKDQGTHKHFKLKYEH